MTVYIEYVVLDNFIIDYLLLYSTFLTTKKRVLKLRLVLGSLFGTAFALFYPISGVDGIFLIIGKILCLILILLFSARYKSAKDFYVHSLIFLTYTFILGGAVIGVFSVLNIDYSSEISIGLMFIPAFILVRFAVSIVKYVKRRIRDSGLIYKVELSVGDKKVVSNGLLDTGNGVYLCGEPVIFASKKTVKKLIEIKSVRTLKYVAVSTVTGREDMPSVKLDSVKIYRKEGACVYDNVRLCVTEKGLSDNYDVILHPDLI